MEDDIELVAAMAAGDCRALAALYERHSGWMLAIGIKITRERREAEDLLHDVFLEAWRTAPTFDPRRGSVVAWLAIRMRSRAIDVRRSARISRNAGDRSLDALIDEREPISPDHARVLGALRQLGPDQRRVLELAYLGQLSSREIAMHLGIPIGTVKSRIAAALVSLRSELRTRAA